MVVVVKLEAIFFGNSVIFIELVYYVFVIIEWFFYFDVRVN